MIDSLDGITIGQLFTRQGDGIHADEVWEVLSYCQLPTLVMRNVRNPNEVIDGGMGCLNLKPFIRLVPEGSTP